MKNKRTSDSLYQELKRVFRFEIPRSGMLFEWLADHRTDLEKNDPADTQLFVLIDEYIRLLQASESAGSVPGPADKRLLRKKERAIVRLISRRKSVATAKS